MNKGVGYCGLVCEMCQDDKDCIGCHQGGCKDKENCKNYVCCQNKHYQGCYECPLFPCQDSILHKLRIRTFCRFIQKFGEKELISCLKNNEKAGIYYHKDHRHYGDYDVFDHEQDIIDLLLQGRVYIRECQLKDHQDIYELNKNELGYDHSLSLTKNKLQKLLASSSDKIFVAVIHDRVIGYVHASDYDVIYMDHLKNIMGIAVCKDYQHQGIGRKLLYAVEKWARETHAAGVRLVSGETRTEAHQFYQICGYAANKKLMHFMKLFNDDKNQ